MFRSDLSFLDKMFQKVNREDYALLIINQTDETRQLTSNEANVRVINSEERGLPQSRNLAIKNAMGDICLVADDDVIYEPGFREQIIEAYTEFPDASVITFQLADADGHPYRKYPDIREHTVKSVGSVNGVVISFKPKDLKENAVYYNEHFGLGSTFKSANEYVFMRNVLEKGLKACFVPLIILQHPQESSGRNEGADSIVFAKAALKYKYNGRWAYLWVLKYIRFLIAHKYIRFSECYAKLKVGYAGIRKYRDLLSSGLENR